MFDSFKAYWYYNKLISGRGVAFERAAMALSNIKTEESVRYLLDILVSRTDLSIEEKRHLANAFSSIGKLASKYLMNQIYDENGDIQYNVISALGEIRETEAVSTFCFLFDKTDNPIFARALADIGDTEALPLLRSKITGNSIARLESLEALFKIAPKEEAPFLVSLMLSSHMIIRQHAVKMLASLSYHFDNITEKNLFYALSGKWDQIITEPGSLSLFWHFVNDSDFGFKRDLVIFLTNNGCNECRRVLYEFLSDYDDEFLIFLITHVKKVKLERFDTLDHLLNLLMHDSVVVRHLTEDLLLFFGKSVLKDLIHALIDSSHRSLLYKTTIQSLCITIGSGSMSLFYNELKNADEQSAPLILGIIGEIGTSSSSDILLQLLSSKDTAHKKSAIRALGESGGEKEIELLLTYLADQNREVRFSIYDALSRISERTSYSVPVFRINGDAEEQAYVSELLFGSE